MLWYTNEKLSDPFRQKWKQNIRYKTDGPPMNGTWYKMKKKSQNTKRHIETPRTTSTMFVPQSRDSLLFKMVSEREDLLKSEMTWGVKILEAPGSKLLNSFVTKFPMEEGCPRGKECCICENTGIKCCTKGVIYLATCVKCKQEGNVMMDGGYSGHRLSDSASTPAYVGETSRPWRERVLEHQQGISRLKVDSVFVEHWMECHELDTECPKFKFQVISSYQDALRRQLCEAIHITEKGTLNRKNEYNNNHLCRLEPSMISWEQEKLLITEVESRKRKKDRLRNFCDVMKDIKSRCKMLDNIDTTDNSNHYRYKKEEVQVVIHQPVGRGSKLWKHRHLWANFLDTGVVMMISLTPQ